MFIITVVSRNAVSKPRIWRSKNKHWQDAQDAWLILSLCIPLHSLLAPFASPKTFARTDTNHFLSQCCTDPSQSCQQNPAAFLVSYSHAIGSENQYHVGKRGTKARDHRVTISFKMHQNAICWCRSQPATVELDSKAARFVDLVL